MKQYGMVLRTDGKLAQVSVRQHSACAQCGKCDMSHESKDLTVSAVNIAGAAAGDMVRLEMAQRDVMAAGLIIYVLPLVVMFIGAAVGQALSGQAVAAGFGFGGLALTYAFIHWRLEPKLRADQRYNISITQVVDEREDFQNHGTEHEDGDN